MERAIRDASFESMLMIPREMLRVARRHGDPVVRDAPRDTGHYADEISQFCIGALSFVSKY